jgi:phosphoribosylanthranilate isomerase
MTNQIINRTSISSNGNKSIKRYIKICGLTKLEQAVAIAKMGADAIGFICVAKSPRYIDKQAIAAITSSMMASQADQMLPDFIGVFVNARIAEICEIVIYAGLTAVQLHGDESPEFCKDLRSQLINQDLFNIKIIKALRVKDDAGLNQAQLFTDHVDALLLDAYDPHLHGGTGKTINWQMLQSFQPKCPWWLAGGLSPENVAEAIAQVTADGLDVSSGVERSAGDKDLERVAQFLAIAL